jgi:hypothetical protein
MQKWEFINIETKIIREPDGTSGIEIKIGSEAAKVYASAVAHDVLNMAKNKLMFLGWELDTEVTIDEVTKYIYKRPVED